VIYGIWWIGIISIADSYKHFSVFTRHGYFLHIRVEYLSGRPKEKGIEGRGGASKTSEIHDWRLSWDRSIDSGGNVDKKKGKENKEEKIQRMSMT
jgi:hypothetical protein